MSQNPYRIQFDAKGTLVKKMKIGVNQDIAKSLYPDQLHKTGGWASP